MTDINRLDETIRILRSQLDKAESDAKQHEPGSYKRGLCNGAADAYLIALQEVELLQARADVIDEVEDRATEVTEAINQLRSRMGRFEDGANESLTINSWYRGPNEWEPGGPQSDLLDALLDIAEAADRLSESLFLRGAAEVHRDHMALHSALYRETQRVDATEFRPISEAEWQVGFRDATALASMSEQDWLDIEEAE